MSALLILAAVAGPGLLIALADGFLDEAMPPLELAPVPMFDDLYGV